MASLKEILLPTSVLVLVIFTIGKNGDASSAFLSLTTSSYDSVEPAKSVTPVVMARLSTFRVTDGGVRVLISCRSPSQTMFASHATKGFETLLQLTNFFAQFSGRLDHARLWQGGSKTRVISSYHWA